MTDSPTLTHALRPEEKQNKVQIRQSLRRSMRSQDVKLPIFGSRLEVALFGLAAVALLATPLIRASVKAKDDIMEVASRLKLPAHVDDTVVTGSVGFTRHLFSRREPARSEPAPAATPDKPPLRGSI